MFILDFLNTNSGAITIIATLFLVGITFWYAWLTRQMLKATINTPDVQISLLTHSKAYEISTIDLCIENIGTGFAYDLKFAGTITDLTPERPTKVHKDYERELGAYGIIKDGIPHLGPGKRYQIALIWYSPTGKYNLPIVPMGPKEPLNIEVTYEDTATKDLAKRKYKDMFLLDFTKVEGYTQIENPMMESIEFSLSQIAYTLLGMRDNMKNENGNSNNTQEEE